MLANELEQSLVASLAKPTQVAASHLADQAFFSLAVENEVAGAVYQAANDAGLEAPEQWLERI